MNSGQFIENCAGSGQPSTSTQAIHIVNDVQVVLGQALKSASEFHADASSDVAGVLENLEMSCKLIRLQRLALQFALRNMKRSR